MKIVNSTWVRPGVRRAQQAAEYKASQERIHGLCPCFPGSCRGGQVVNGLLANGQRCKAEIK